MVIQFTDRYGGNPPSWLRSCGECEAMGYSPEPCDQPKMSPESDAIGAHSPCPRPAEHRQPDFDGWHFLRCLACDGTGRISWLGTLGKLPRWLVQGWAFFWQAQQYGRPPHLSWLANEWLIFKCAFVYDLMRLRR